MEKKKQNTKAKFNTQEFFNELNQCFSDPMFAQSETSNQEKFLYTLHDNSGKIIKKYN